MKDLINKIKGILNNKDVSSINNKDIYKVCTAANEELGNYCRIEGFGGR